MNPADKVKIKQIYLEDTGTIKPDTDITDYVSDIARFLGRERYGEFIRHFWADEPDTIAINEYIEWLESKLIDELKTN